MSIDMRAVIEPRSDQLNSDDLIAGPRTITISDVHIRGGQEQPVSIRFEGDGGKPWKPCKSMSRVLVSAWGPDASKYVGRTLTLYRDPKVKWAGMEVGGIRISHMSHIDGERTLALTVTKGKREHTIIKPLAVQQERSADRDGAEGWVSTHIGLIESAETADELQALQTKSTRTLAKLEKTFPDLFKQVYDAFRTAMVDLAPAKQGRTDAHGDQFAEDEDRDPRAETAARIEALIAEATDEPSFNEANKQYLMHCAGLPDDIQRELNDALTAKRRELKNA